MARKGTCCEYDSTQHNALRTVIKRLGGVAALAARLSLRVFESCKCSEGFRFHPFP